MKFTPRPFTYEELITPVPFERNSIAAKIAKNRLIHIYGFTKYEAEAALDHCCSIPLPIIRYLAPLMETNPELFI